MVGGGVWPVVHRELRAGARRPFDHWLRVAGALGGVCVFCVSALNAPISTVGSQIFLGVHQLLMVLILCVVPAIAADCIARERREGTLGLLFLTPLRSWEIVLGKVLTQVLKALTLWLAVLPVLAIPFLMGGVGWRELVRHLTSELCAGMFCLAAGIMASSLAEKRATAFVLAFAFAAALVFGLTEERWWNVLRWTPGPTITMSMTTQPGLTYYYNLAGGQSPLISSTPIITIVSLLPLGGKFLFALVVLWGAIRFAGFCVERSWKDRIPSQLQQNWVRRYCTPLFDREFERRMRRTLEWNPIAWLQQYSWRARLTKWGICLALVVMECTALAPANFYEIIQRESVILALLAAVYTYAGVNGFLEEKKSGALELILVTPLTVNQILLGRVWGLWKQFFPAALILAICIYYTNQLSLGNLRYYLPGQYAILNGPFGGWDARRTGLSAVRNFSMIVGFFTLPVFATFSALRVKNMVLATAYTWVMLALAPVMSVLGLALAARLSGAKPALAPLFLGTLAGNAICVLVILRALRRGLARRNYSF
ncbi:MAG TPA: ABC transporter permease subunit [Candidatus Baltobacteraceae bacterium]|jgi:ABC-type Na+ efflux pump permease subunit|nr:ABC transporter permease subunit [Candidatus Baltobacteraceae bacterium]